MEIHKRFKIAREKIGYTQEDIANLIGVKTGSMSKIENGHGKMPHWEYLGVLKEQGISSNWLLFEQGEMMENDNKEYPSDYEEIKKENSYLKDKIQNIEKIFEQKLEKQRLEFLEIINKISGKQSEHKQAAHPNGKRNNSVPSGWTCVPASV
ncbi:helix-turn-helix domain-containing protein [Bernardetia sp. Wsw4-3y2]|uniref:helix-turn-helix domain-containing protein n=1 Tax=Bernardetia sp. Wsw4-3y2 TaxID=3127471 RepID=UPI0030CB9F46